MVEIDFTIVPFIISFLLFMFLMNMVFFKPVAKVIREREGSKSSDQDSTQYLIEQADSKVEQYQENIHNAQKEATAIVAEALEQANDKKQSMIDHAVADIDTHKLGAIESISKEQIEIIKGLNATVKELTSLMVGKILSDKDIKVDLSDEKIHKIFENKANVQDQKKEILV